jgi:hypothetical protein
MGNCQGIIQEAIRKIRVPDVKKGDFVFRAYYPICPRIIFQVGIRHS